MIASGNGMNGTNRASIDRNLVARERYASRPSRKQVRNALAYPAFAEGHAGSSWVACRDGTRNGTILSEFRAPRASDRNRDPLRAS